MIRRSAAVSSTPPGARVSARTVPVTSTDVSCVRPPNASHAASGTSFFESTTCRYPVPSRSITRSEEHTSELQSQSNLVCRLLLEKKKKKYTRIERGDD